MSTRAGIGWDSHRLEAGETLVLAAKPGFELLARNPLGEGSHSTPAIAGGAMYLRTFSHLISIGK